MPQKLFSLYRRSSAVSRACLLLTTSVNPLRLALRAPLAPGPPLTHHPAASIVMKSDSPCRHFPLEPRTRSAILIPVDLVALPPRSHPSPAPAPAPAPLRPFTSHSRPKAHPLKLHSSPPLQRCDVSLSRIRNDPRSLLPKRMRTM